MAKSIKYPFLEEPLSSDALDVDKKELILNDCKMIYLGGDSYEEKGLKTSEIRNLDKGPDLLDMYLYYRINKKWEDDQGIEISLTLPILESKVDELKKECGGRGATGELLAKRICKYVDGIIAHYCSDRPR